MSGDLIRYPCGNYFVLRRLQRWNYIHLLTRPPQGARPAAIEQRHSENKVVALKGNWVKDCTLQRQARRKQAL